MKYARNKNKSDNAKKNCPVSAKTRESLQQCHMEAYIQLSSVTSYAFVAWTRTFVPVPRIYFSIQYTYLTLQFPRIFPPSTVLFTPNISYHFAFKVTLELFIIYLYIVDQDSSDGITTRYGLDVPGVEFRCAAKFSVQVLTGPEDQ
jgi:hypothetical protein